MKSKEDLDIQNARVALLYSNRYAYLSRDPRGGSRLIEATDVVAVGPNPSWKGEDPEGQRLRAPGLFQAARRGAAHGTGQITGVTWKVKATLDVNEEPL